MKLLASIAFLFIAAQFARGSKGKQESNDVLDLVKKAFKEADANSDELLNREEFQKFLIKGYPRIADELNEEQKGAVVAKLIEIADKNNKDGKLSMEELINSEIEMTESVRKYLAKNEILQQKEGEDEQNGEAN